eukprot:jgi/Mesvir1/27434/Mv07223-RA.1
MEPEVENEPSALRDDQEEGQADDASEGERDPTTPASPADEAKPAVPENQQEAGKANSKRAKRKAKGGSKKGRKNAKSAAGATAGDGVDAKTDFRTGDELILNNYSKISDFEGFVGTPVLLSQTNKAAQIVLSADRMAATGEKGYRMARATHCVHEGAWYYEIKVEFLGETGHVRLGWCTAQSDLQTPVGFDAHGYSYRDIVGDKVHAARRQPYGEGYKEGDVIGCYIYIPPGLQKPSTVQRVEYQGAFYAARPLAEEPASKNAKPEPLPGSAVAFFKNGVFQGVAFRDINDGCYYPAVSTYTLPKPVGGGACVRCNFGPTFAFPPVLPEDLTREGGGASPLPPPRPMSDQGTPLQAVAPAATAGAEPGVVSGAEAAPPVTDAVAPVPAGSGDDVEGGPLGVKEGGVKEGGGTECGEEDGPVKQES